MDFSLTTLFVVPSGDLAAEGFKRENLKPGQFGIFNSRYKAVKTATEAVKSPHIVFGQGRIESVPGLTHKYSDKISRGSLVDWYKTTASPNTKNQITYAGFDGVDNTKTIKVGCDEQVSLTIRARSLYIDTAFAYGLTRTVTVTTPCCEDCGDDCETVDPRFVANAWAEKINNEPYLSKFVLATPVFECETPADEETVIETVTYCVSVCDTGDGAALAEVQSQYPDDVVTRSERNGAISTYQIERLASDPAPADVVITRPISIAICETCPAGYTFVDAQNRYIVERALDGSEDLDDEVARQAYADTFLLGYVATGTATFLENTGGTAKVLLTVDEELVAEGVDIFTQIDDTEAICTPPAGASTAWASCDTGFKVQRTLNITLADDCDPAITLANLVEMYPDADITLVESANCNTQYQMVQTSETSHEECDFKTPAKFAQVQPYQGIEWVLAPTTLTGATCVAGVRIEGKTLDKYGNPCDPIAFPHEWDQLTFEVFAYKGAATSQDFLTHDRCDNIPITTVQKATVATGSGDEIFMLEKRYHSYQTTMKHIFHNSIWNGAFVRYSNPNQFYDTYVLKFKSPDLLTWDASSRQDETVIIAVPTGSGSDLENFLLGYFGDEKFTAGVLGQSL